MSDHRIVPIRGSEVSRRAHAASVLIGENAMQPGEYHSSTDAAGFSRHFIEHRHVGGYLPHGDVASEAEMLALDRPAYAHAVFPGDTCRRTDLAGSPVMLCISGHGTLAADWVSLGGGGAIGSAWGSITGTLSAQTDLAAALAAKADASALAAKADASALAAKADASALAAKWDTPTNESALDLLGTLAGSPTWNGGAWPISSGGLDPYEGTPPAADRDYTYTAYGDAGGICYAIASQFGGPWSAPGQLAFATTGKIGCQWSGALQGSSIDVVDRASTATMTTDTAGAWIALDLGMQVRATDYTIRNRSGSTGYALRNWKLQGCNTAPGSWTPGNIAAMSWVDVDTRTADTTMTDVAAAWGRFVIPTPPETRYRFFRILSTGLNSSGGNHVNMGEIELYGTTSTTPTLPSGARGWLTDGLGRFVPWW